MVRPPPRSPLFPYTALFPSVPGGPRPRLFDVHLRLAEAPVRGDGVPGDHLRRYAEAPDRAGEDRKSTRLNSSHANISYAVFCLKKKEGDRDAATLRRGARPL